MEISFQSRKLEKECNNDRLLQKTHGKLRAKLIRRRLDDLRDVENLAVMRAIVRGRCHELKGNLAGCVAIDLDGPFRLIFEPAHDPIPIKGGGGLDWVRITAIRILRIEDYHG